MRIGKLTALEVKRLMQRRATGLKNDGGGLYLKEGSSWIFRFASHGKKHDHGLGPALDISLARAREKAADARALLLAGRDPIKAKRASRAVSAARKTFRECAESYIESHRAGWRSEKHLRQWQGSLANHVYPHIGDLDVAEIDTPDILRVLRQIWNEKSETAARLRSRLELVLDSATAAGLRGEGLNPARWKGHLQSLFPAARKVSRVAHFAALDYREVGDFLRALRGQRGVAALALEFVVLTAARSGEALGAEWREFDLAGRLWTVPGSRMKGGRDHRVPLSDRVLAVLAEMEAVGESDFVFAGLKRGRHLTNAALQESLSRTGRRDCTVHGFRSTFRDWAGNETSFPREIAEAALAHVVGDSTEQAYRRSDALERRRALMSAWASYCGEPIGERGKVIALGANKKVQGIAG
jgi:integrase